MSFVIWLLGVIAFFIYDHIIGFDVHEDDDFFRYLLLASFWFITVPVLFIKYIKKYLSRKR